MNNIIRHSSDFGRLYQIEKQVFPSVTTVLSLYQNEGLNKFRSEVGEEFFSKLGRTAANRGSVMHKYLENYLIALKDGKTSDESLTYTQENTPNDPELNGLDLKAWKTGKQLFYNFWYDGVLNNIKTVLENELYLWASTTEFKVEGGYAGTTDFIFLDINDNLILADFKSSKKAKDKKDIVTYYLQIAAYMFAYYQRQGKFPNQGQIWISNELTNEIQKVIIPKDKWKDLFKMFLNLLNKWYKINENNLNKWKQNNE